MNAWKRPPKRIRLWLSGTLLSGLVAHSATALPMYTNALWLEDGKQAPGPVVLQRRAAQLRRITDYIQETFRLSPNKTVAIVTEAVYSARKHDLDPALILAIIAVESTFRERAVSNAGARGLMQVMPQAHPGKVRAIGGADALFYPPKNIATGSRILLEYLNESGGNLRRALLRYNGSLGNPDSAYPGKVLSLYRKFRRMAQLDEIG